MPDARLDDDFAAIEGKAVPVHVAGGVARWPAASWTFSSLAARVGDAQVPVHTGRWKSRGWRVAREGATRLEKASEFLSDLDGGGAAGRYLAGDELLRRVPALNADLWFPSRGAVAVDVVWIGPAGTVTPIHFDLAPNYYAQLVGEKRWTFWRPARKLSPRFAGLGGFAMSALDAGAGAERAGPPDMDLVARAGDLLFIPSGWWHRVETQKASIAVNRWWRFRALRGLRQYFERGRESPQGGLADG